MPAPLNPVIGDTPADVDLVDKALAHLRQKILAAVRWELTIQGSSNPGEPCLPPDQSWAFRLYLPVPAADTPVVVGG